MDRLSQASENAFETVPVGNRQYRRVKAEFSTAKAAKPFAAPKASSSVCVDDEPDSCEVGNVQEPSGYEIKSTATGFHCDLPVDPKCFSSIIGPKGATVGKIRQTTGCNVSVPRDSKTASIPISGPSEAAVAEAITAVLAIVNGSQQSAAAARPRQRLEFDFFVSIPLLSAQFKDELDIFHNEVKTLINAGQLKMEPRALMKANSLHFTLTMLHLHTAENIQRAEVLLASLTPEILDMCGHKALEIDFGALKTFDDSKITSANIIFVEPGQKSMQVLKPIGDLIRTKFAEAGLVNDPKEEARPLVLHATLANTRPNRVDATPMVSLPSARFSSFTVPEIHLSQRFNYDANGYYHCASKIELPTA
jgi:activating signal cointegrator complex subunit 1